MKNASMLPVERR